MVGVELPGTELCAMLEPANTKGRTMSDTVVYEIGYTLPEHLGTGNGTMRSRYVTYTLSGNVPEGGVTPEWHRQITGSNWKARLQEAAEAFGNELDTITEDEYSFNQPQARAYRREADRVNALVTAQTGCDIDLEVGGGYAIDMMQADGTLVMFYLVKLN